jgi:hypothetical protein
LLVLTGRGAVTAVWDGNSEVTIVMDDSFHTKEMPSASVETMGVRVAFRRVSENRTPDGE